MSRAIFMLAAAVFAAAVVGCGSDAVGASPTALPTAVVEPTPTAEPSDFEKILQLMPDTQESRDFTSVNLFHELAVALEVDVPGPDATVEEVMTFRERLLGRGIQTSVLSKVEVWISGFHTVYTNQIPETRASLGFDSRDIAISAISGEREDTSPMPLLEVVIGSIDSVLAVELLDQCTECAGLPTKVAYSGSDYFSWGRDFGSSMEASLKPPLFDELGRGGRLFFGDGLAVRALRTQDMEAFLDVQSGSAPSLADSEKWSLAAKAISDLGTLSANFTEWTEHRFADWPQLVGLDRPPRENLPPEVVEKLDKFDEIAEAVAASAPELPSFEMVAAGTGLENGRAYAALAVVFRDQATAQQASLALQSRALDGLTITADLETMPWSEMIETADVSVDGRVVKVKILPQEVPPREQAGALRPFLSARPFLNDVPFILFLLR